MTNLYPTPKTGFGMFERLMRVQVVTRVVKLPSTDGNETTSNLSIMVWSIATRAAKQVGVCVTAGDLLSAAFSIYEGDLSTRTAPLRTNVPWFTPTSEVVKASNYITRGLFKEATFTDMRTLFLLYARIDSFIPWTSCSQK